MNLGNGWEAPPDNTWGVHFTTEDIDRIAAEGFDHIRVPVAWHFYLKPDGHGMEIDPALLAEIEPVLRHALEKNLHVMLNWHHFNDFTAAPADNLGRFISGWETIAAHFKSWPPGLFFELLNEPCDALTTEVANPIYQKTIAAIRETNAERMIVVSPGHWGIVGELDSLRLPDADDRIIVTIHCYEPFHFTHQGAGWTGFQNLRGIAYPGPPATPSLVPDSMRENAGVVSFIERYNTLPGDSNPMLEARDPRGARYRPRVVAAFRPARAPGRVRRPRCRGCRQPRTLSARCEKARRRTPHPMDTVGVEIQLRLLGRREKPAEIPQQLVRVNETPIP